jgi:hypothetical protein
MKKIFSSLSVLILFTSCYSSEGKTSLTNVFPNKQKEDSSVINTIGTTIETRFKAPESFERIQLDSNSFGFYLRTLTLKTQGESVKLYNGSLKSNQEAHIAVIDQDIDPVDLQQCADAVMRLRGEYLFQQKRFKDIHFNFLSDGKPRYFLEYANGDLSYKKFRAYMKYIFSYANTASLKKELTMVGIETILPGDVFIQSGNPYGHAVTVVDVAQDAQGNRVYLLAQSYMPAQETHLLINPKNQQLSPWYEAKDGAILTPEWRFESTDLRRFKD